MISTDSSIKTKSDMKDKCLEITSEFNFMMGNSIVCDIYGKGFHSTCFDKRPINSAESLISFVKEVAEEIKNDFLKGKYVVEAFSLRTLRKIDGKLCIETCYIDTDYFVALYYNDIIDPNNRQLFVNNLGKTRVEYKNPASVSGILYPVFNVLKMNYKETWY